MSIRAPWHAKEDNVYHVNSDCKAGQKIDRLKASIGKGGKELCPECAALSPKPSGVSSADPALAEMLKRMTDSSD